MGVSEVLRYPSFFIAGHIQTRALKTHFPTVLLTFFSDTCTF